MPRCVDFSEGKKPEYPEKNPRSTGEINYGSPIHMNFHTRLGLSSERHNAQPVLPHCFEYINDRPEYINDRPAPSHYISMYKNTLCGI